MSDSNTGVPDFQRVIDASASGDIATLVSLFTNDAVVMPPNDTTLFGSEEIREWWKEYFQWFQVTSTVVTDSDLTIAGDQAFHRGSLSIVIEPKGKGERIRDDIRSLTVWRLQTDGAWKISHQIWNSTRPVGSGTSRYISRMIQKKSS
jgi:ketosteroid isomerase-like protein